MTPKSLMTQYIEGSIVSRELERMLIDYAAEVDFAAEITEYTNQKHFLYKGDHKQ